ncbi:hypothetical protein MA03_07115 [Infirmifilum uzonense]|uniref:Ribosomal RNA small subunit methyltransferase Nep1 n=1 Tax=Infirmifilum uzonense TaxID=1550241 RepID=A0A0F7FK46_9CREN|nr:16S rRNA methyltransferase [Infirmifilum uzonense]AKG39428.1 hypothetical protein MA03_07115 [Infirmifilum uzonense]
MRKAHLILADASLELVPKEIQWHPAVLNSARRMGKKPGEILLDKSLHYPAMHTLRYREKRGRPDIVHVCLLISQGSLLNQLGLLKTTIHTISGEVIEVNPSTRVPRNYNRFLGVMSQLLSIGRVPPSGEPILMWKTGKSLTDHLKENNTDFVALLNESGAPTTPKRLAEKLIGYENPAVIIGAYPHGDFSDEVYNVANQVFSLGGRSLDAWTVLARIIASLEDALGLWDAL